MQRIRKGDRVKVIAGKDLGTEGEVLIVLPKKDRIVVSGVNQLKRHRKARQVGTQQIPAQIIDFDAPFHISNVMLVCPSCQEATRVGFKVKEDSVKVRFCKKCNSEIK
ncbi:MAG: 50S ribosomal protein L24 [Anaerolineae bacterium]|nr:50S ribosomal protein L24 [Anaerolineae bacterium]